MFDRLEWELEGKSEEDEVKRVKREELFKREGVATISNAIDQWDNHEGIGDLDKRCFLKLMVRLQTRMFEDTTKVWTGDCLV